MMGAGKSTVGKALAEIADREFLDTDVLLQARLGRPIPQIFQIYGEETFRDHESSVLRNLEPGLTVLATGGGIVLREENWIEMERLGTTVFLNCPFDVLKDRLEQSKRKRPLLQTENWEQRLEALLEARMPLYRRAKVIVDLTDGDIDDVAAGIHQRILEAL